MVSKHNFGKVSAEIVMASADIPRQLKRLEIPGRVSFLEGNGELPKIELNSDYGSAEVYLHGAQVTDWKLNSPKIDGET